MAETQDGMTPVWVGFGSFGKCGHPEGNPAVLAVDVVNIS